MTIMLEELAVPAVDDLDSEFIDEWNIDTAELEVLDHTYPGCGGCSGLCSGVGGRPCSG
ncbi:hypothetical protein [Streptacidiphilus pinicola]|uniref:hypothetical protein n=1 Tax=Streptacidiphilus pinicola TaxID=2219663 RepID=UPI0014033DC3|nr:hypothetical protein [Streptacidiphilus pinicola]